MKYPMALDETQNDFGDIKLSPFFDLNFDLMAVADFEGKFVKLNSAWVPTLGHSMEDLLSGKFLDIVHPEDMEKTLGAISQLADGQNITRFTNRYRHKNGTYRILEWGASTEGKYIYAIARDVTDSVLLEDSLQTQKELLSEMGHMASVGAWELDVLTFQTKWTGEIYKIYEVPPDFDSNAEVGISYYHPEDKNIIVDAVNRAIQKGESFDLNLRLVPTSGKIKWVRAVGKPFYKDGKMTKVIGSFQDITEQVIEERIKERSLSELLQAKNELQNYKYALDQTAIVSLTDANGIIIDLNHNFTAISGYSREELLGSTHKKINSGYHSKDFFKSMWKTIKSGKIWRGEIKNRAKSGVEYWVATSIIPFLNAEGKPESYYSIRFDITNAKKSAQIVLEAKEAAELANKAKTEFLSNMSHEIRTPLNSVIGYTQLLADTKLDLEQMRFAQDAKTSAYALLGIINDILDFSKIEAGKVELEFQDVYLYPFLDECVQIVNLDAKKKNLDLKLVTSSNLPETVCIDPTRLKQVLVNLLGNAIKFTEVGSVSFEVGAEFSADNESKTLSFRVKDTGIGISEDQKGRLFQVFSQADNSITRKFGGTGLGLVISAKLVEQMGGELSLESKLGSGSTFSFSVPLLPISELENVSYSNSIDENLIRIRLNITNVLVAEDNHLNARLVETMLLKIYPNLKISFAHNGEEAVNIQKGSPVDLILMDLHMPVMDGVHATKIIREMERATGSHVPIIALTAGATSEEKEACAEAGMDDFLTKPIIAVKLKETLQKFIY